MENKLAINSPYQMDFSALVKVEAPATVANMVCGFDVLGFAVNEPFDKMQIRFNTLVFD